MKRKLLIVCLLLAASITAQVTTSKIKGLVTDASGEALIGANIVALHTPTGTVSGTIAQENGRYTLSNLRVGGPYTVTITFVGFKSKKVTGVFLTLGETSNIDAVLTEDANTLEEVVILSLIHI